jgi:hypothetical protein
VRRLIIIIGLPLALLPALALAQDEIDDQPEVGGTVVVGADEPTIDEPQVGVETPDSRLPDDLEDSPLPQWWVAIAGAVSAGLAALFIRWTPASLWLRLGPARSIDLKRGFALVAAVVTGIIGAWFAGTLAFDKVTLSAILYTAVAGWLTREVIPGAKALTHGIEGPPPPPQTP